MANEQKILQAAEEVFADQGFAGATTSAIAHKAGLPKANIHYYFRTKEDLIHAVLENILTLWLDSADVIVASADPAVAISRYIKSKIEYSRDRPNASKVFASEILHGAPYLEKFLRTRLKERVEQKSAVFKVWIEQGLMDPISPEHLFFLIWSATQTYADFETQVAAVLGRKSKPRPKDFDQAADFITRIILKGCGIRSRK
ncbi:MAG TPA: TetR/AcrR family transcriptional regulator [Rhodospirillales bacterium]|nr:TetR/AcrR family transcriptional regulator [Rhodospirillales bacterium]